MSSLFENQVLSRIQQAGIPPPIQEYKFLKERRFKFDFAWPEKMLAVECEGGVWISGRHNRGIGFINDCRKYNLAALSGWLVLRYTPDMIDEIIINLKGVFHEKVKDQKGC